MYFDSPDSAPTHRNPHRRRGRPTGNAGLDRPKRREELLDAAEAVARRTGDLRFIDVAREIGYSRNICYTIFPTIADLAQALSERHANRLLNAIQNHSLDTRSRQSLCHDVASTLVRWVIDEPILARALDYAPLGQVVARSLPFGPAPATDNDPDLTRALLAGGVVRALIWWAATPTVPTPQLIDTIGAWLAMPHQQPPSVHRPSEHEANLQR